jgi:hypothetical protein
MDDEEQHTVQNAELAQEFISETTESNVNVWKKGESVITGNLFNWID